VCGKRELNKQVVLFGSLILFVFFSYFQPYFLANHILTIWIRTR